MRVVGTKVVFALVSPSVMPCVWVVFTGFLRDLRHGCGGLVGWQMVLLCWSVSSGWDSGGLGTCGVEADARVCVRDAMWLVNVQLSCVCAV